MVTSQQLPLFLVLEIGCLCSFDAASAGLNRRGWPAFVIQSLKQIWSGTNSTFSLAYRRTTLVRQRALSILKRVDSGLL